MSLLQCFQLLRIFSIPLEVPLDFSESALGNILGNLFHMEIRDMYMCHNKTIKVLAQLNE